MFLREPAFCRAFDRTMVFGALGFCRRMVFACAQGFVPLGFCRTIAPAQGQSFYRKRIFWQTAFCRMMAYRTATFDESSTWRRRFSSCRTLVFARTMASLQTPVSGLISVWLRAQAWRAFVRKQRISVWRLPRGSGCGILPVEHRVTADHIARGGFFPRGARLLRTSYGPGDCGPR